MKKIDVTKIRNGERGTGVTRLRIQNGGQKKKKKKEEKKKKERKGSKRNNLRKRDFLPAVPPDDQYVLVRAESDWHWEKRSM